ncbi:MAG TPA: CsgG/HfaB family protein [Candidatus Latescibacteria bacterium]|nr:CsgG/HfaB family protein [Candidatus Latescibacterota bacterium]HOF61506.1 CsgG/HfaB family protein [Candidatus Latescibacterota bacterium]HOS63910.1 CsgG/HfaB family protein [Candidatus Latescibacterota bacterium]HPK73801.1 CsgG/HfaB family protein [Candidatus Latescibacterota bacterium]HPX39836.1 CsgG/HfaB family protein [Candidatus Hydrogenedentota bacterium]
MYRFSAGILLCLSIVSAKTPAEPSLIHVLRWGRSAVNCVAITPDGQQIIAGNGINLHIWNLPNGDRVRRLPVSGDAGHLGEVLSVAVTPDGQTIVSASADRTIKIWRLSDGRLLRTLRRHGGAVNSVCVTPDGAAVIAGCQGWINNIEIWRLSDGTMIRSLPGHRSFWGRGVNSVAVSPDGKTIFSGGDDKKIKMWRLSDGSLLRTLPVSRDGGHGRYVSHVALSPDGQVVYSASGDKVVKVWQVSDGEALGTFSPETDFLTSLALSADGQTIAMGCGDGSAGIWSLSAQQQFLKLPGHTRPVTCVAVSPRGDIVVSGSLDKTLRVWRLAGSTSGAPAFAVPPPRITSAPAVAAASGTAIDTTVSVLLTGLECPGMDSVRSGTLTEKLRVELDQAGGFRVMERDRLDAIMAEQGRWLSGCFTNTCASNIGDLAGADYVIVGRVAQVEDMYSVTLRIVETATSETVGSAAIECSPCTFSAVMRESMRAAAVALRDDFQRRLRSRQ